MKTCITTALRAALLFCLITPATTTWAQEPAIPAGEAATTDDERPEDTPLPETVFRLGEIVNVGAVAIGLPGVGGATLTRSQAWTFERSSLDQAVNMVPGVSSTLDTNGRRNESDIFVRGFGRWQVPLMVDGVRIYLPADNRLDFARFLTADIAAVQIQKGYASVLDGPGAMGGAINLVTSRPTRAFQAEGGLSGGGRSDVAGSNGYAMLGSKQRLFYVQLGAAYSDRDHWTLSGHYRPTTNSLQPSGDRLGSDSQDWSVNGKLAFTPTPANEYTLSVSKQSGEKGAPLNVFNNPPVPPNSYWRWPYWDIQNVSFLTNTQLGSSAYVKTRLYRNSFRNGLDAYDDASYTTQSLNGRFTSPYDDHAWGGGAEAGLTSGRVNTLKASVYYRQDVHNEQQTSRPTNVTARSTEPNQEQAQTTWSLAGENTWHASGALDVVTGLSYEKYAITKAQEYNATRGLFNYPLGGSDAVNAQAAVIWRTSSSSNVHLSVSDRSRFPVIFELYSTRFGTATPNPDLGPERATNLEAGWSGRLGPRGQVEATAFVSRVRDLIQTVVLPDTTTQTQNVGNGRFGGIEFSATWPLTSSATLGGNYTLVHRRVTDALQPNLRPTGVPTLKAFLYASLRPVPRLTITPSLDVAGDRWSDVNPAPAFPYVRTGAYTLLNMDATVKVVPQLEVAAGLKNATDDDYQLAWGFPQPGRSFYVKTRVTF